MKFITVIIIVLTVVFVCLFINSAGSKISADTTPSVSNSWWEIQSVDTMKYSRDMARQGLKDSTMPGIIDQQVTEIASVGATHITIDTPYDDEFLPYMRMWIAAARKHSLKIWFRGNWSGWEGWFGYAKITRTDHLTKTKQFILGHPDLFEDGDIFSACPECENGGPGDPRTMTNVGDYRQFLLDEYQITINAFAAIHKNVRSDILSMNADIARLVMNRDVAVKLGGIITIDHYAKDPMQYAVTIDNLVTNTGSKIMLGEFGAPVPDITGNLTATDQALWLHAVLDLLAARRENVIGVNYWVGVGGSTGIWDTKGTATPAVSVLRSFFTPGRKISLQVKNDLHHPVAKIPVSWLGRTYQTDKAGRVDIPYLETQNNSGLLVGGYGSVYGQVTVMATPSTTVIPVTITPLNQSIFYRINKLFIQLFHIQ